MTSLHKCLFSEQHNNIDIVNRYYSVRLHVSVVFFSHHHVEYCLTKWVLTHIKLDLPKINVIIVIITVKYYIINMTVFKLILQPGNNGLRNWFQHTAICQEDHCSLFENIRCSKSKTRRDIQFKSKTQNLYKYTGCNRRNGPDFGRVFLMLNYTENPQNTYIQSSMVTEI